MNENIDIDITMNIKNEIKSNDVVLFMKGTPAFPMCGFSATVVQILNNMGVTFNSINADEARRVANAIAKIYVRMDKEWSSKNALNSVKFLDSLFFPDK